MVCSLFKYEWPFKIVQLFFIHWAFKGCPDMPGQPSNNMCIKVSGILREKTIEDKFIA